MTTGETYSKHINTLLVPHSHIPPRTLKSKQIEAPLSDLTYLIPDTPPEKGMVVVDTSEVFAGLEGEGDTANRKSLEQVARLLDLHPQFMHNAGNDAHVRSEGYQNV